MGFRRWLRSQGWDKLGGILALIGIISGLIPMLTCPYLTYEEARFSIQEGKSLHVVIVRNEGHRVTEGEVLIYIDTCGQIENVIGQWELITGKMEERQYFREYVSFSSKNSSFRGELPYLPCGMAYKLCLVVIEQKGDESPDKILILSPEGPAEKYRKSCFVPFVIGLGLGACSIGVVIVFLYFRRINIKVDRNKKDGKRNRDEARGEEAKKD